MNENEHLPYKQERIDATEKTLKKNSSDFSQIAPQQPKKFDLNVLS